MLRRAGRSALSLVSLVSFAGCASEPGTTSESPSSSSSGAESRPEVSSDTSATAKTGTIAVATTEDGPECGNGVVEANEECDDANLDQRDDCLNSCIVAFCGDGFVHTGFESCDDGNLLNDDACTTTCELARCGDGVVHLGVEECDDANEDPNDGCNDECVRTRLVFLTSEYYQGDLGGLRGADQKCQTLASIAELPRPSKFMAWLADGTGAPADRFHRSLGRYALVTGIPIADGWQDLTDGTLLAPINVDETGELLEFVAVFTNTTEQGYVYDADYSCDDWTTTSFQKNAWVGNGGASDASWVADNEVNPYFCPDTARLYCFEQ
ncbi:MAG: DUF4215 domain-containing protein [Myxococcales bacterium]|nr:DUF4215 domain-containing protein [Myxococcales bacterium]